MVFVEFRATASPPALARIRAVLWRPRLGAPGFFLAGFVALATLLIALSAGFAAAHNANDAKPGNPGVERRLLHQTPLPDFPEHIMTALTVELAPGAVVGPHRHGGFVYVYLLQGQIRSQMEGEDPVDYVAGQSWIELSEALHSQTVNLSTTEPAKFLAVIYSEADAVITRPEKDSH